MNKTIMLNHGGRLARLGAREIITHHSSDALASDPGSAPSRLIVAAK